jgi:hypothetical protein
MMTGFGQTLITLASLIATIAIISVVVSPKAKTASVIQATASGWGNNIAEAVSPVTGTGATPNLGYPGGSGGMNFGGGVPSFNS